jgi:hypothetical protein
VRSSRSAYEKAPWKHLEELDGVVEAEFVRAVYLGESVLPTGSCLRGRRSYPWEGDRLLDGSEGRLDLFPGMARWWRDAEALWTAHRTSDRLTLSQRIDYRRTLTGQVPASPLRVVYSKSGMHLAAAAVRDARALVDHVLYWAAVETEDEAAYLLAVLNSATTTELVRPLMSYGKDERHIDKYVWELPIPRHDPADADHVRLVELSREAEASIAALDLAEDAYFVGLRRRVREHLAASDAEREIDELVTELMGL